MKLETLTKSLSIRVYKKKKDPLQVESLCAKIIGD